MLNIPNHITAIFILTTLVGWLICIMSVYRSDSPRVVRRTNLVALLLIPWLIFQSTLALNGWYMNREIMPPHLIFPIVVSTVVILMLFFIPRLKQFISGISLVTLMWVHLLRVPIEYCLYELALNKQLPWSMTFNGYNFDIVFGLSAPLIVFLFMKKRQKFHNLLMIWNLAGLVSVFAVVIRGIGAAPSPIQWWDFSQPNYAVMHFPFIWLPSFLVPLVIFTHFLTLSYLRKVSGRID
jgi:hypothetical protein